IWGTNVTPGTPDSGDRNAVELGLKFRTDTFGTITGVRFYKASTNTGTHVGNLWSASGQLLARGTFTGETASGWQTVSFAQPVPPPGQASNVIASAGNASAALTWNAPTSGGPVTTYIVTPYIGTTPQATTSVTGSPAPTTAIVTGLTNGTTYTFTVTASNPNG